MSLENSRTAAKARMRAAIEAGKYPNAEAWCRAVLASTDPRIPTEWRLFAVGTLTLVLRQTDRDPLAWARALKEREEAGEVLYFVQQKAWRRALEDEVRAVEEQRAELREATDEEDLADLPM